MNFVYYQKVLALPIQSTMKGVLRTLAYHCNPKANNLCIPSWDSIQDESGVSRDVIGKSIRIAKELGIITLHHRGDIETGKQSNQYFFLFDGIKFYKNNGKWKLSKSEKENFKQRLKRAKQTIEEEDKVKGKQKRSAFPVKSIHKTISNSPDRRTIQKPQKSSIELSTRQGIKEVSKSPDTRLINPDSRPEVIDTMVLPTNDAPKDINNQLCNTKNKKTVLHDKILRAELSFTQELNKGDSTKNRKKKPSEQTSEEWLAAYEDALNK